MTEAKPLPLSALTALLQYQQADEDGVMVLASRQAIHEVSDYITSLQAENAALVEAVETAFNHIDEVMGDTDPDDEDDPLLLASQALAPFCGDNLISASAALLKRLEALKIENEELENKVTRILKRTAEVEVEWLHQNQREKK